MISESCGELSLSVSGRLFGGGKQMFVELVWQHATYDGRVIGVYGDGSELDITGMD